MNTEANFLDYLCFATGGEREKWRECPWGGDDFRACAALGPLYA